MSDAVWANVESPVMDVELLSQGEEVALVTGTERDLPFLFNLFSEIGYGCTESLT